MYYCKTCGKMVNSIAAGKPYIDMDIESIPKCKICGYYKRNNFDTKVKSIVVEDFDELDYRNLIEFIFSNEVVVLNIVSKMLKKDMLVVYNAIQRLGLRNKTFRVDTTCEMCDKEMLEEPYVFFSNKFVYCSKECYYSARSEKIGSGDYRKNEDRIQTFCSNCKKTIFITPYDYSKKNRFGDSNNFCCQECYWEFRSKYYVGEKSSMTNVSHSADTILKFRRAVAKRYENRDLVRDTKIQLKTNSILEDIGISYAREKVFEYYAVDNFLTDYNLIIEVHGDYWHANPHRYNESKYELNKTQANGIHRDKIKKSFIKNKYNIDILYLWESDIDNNPILCRELIKTYVNQGGKLPNYNSFNYSICPETNAVILNESIVVTYQEVSVDKYRHLIKT